MAAPAQSNLRRHRAGPRPPGRGSVLLIVLITLLFAGTALTLFIDRASDDLLVEIRAADAARLRPEAYSALETTLGVLQEFIQTNGSLKSPAEGWNDPLGWAGYEPESGRTVQVEFADESSKVSLPHATQPYLVTLFKGWDIPQADAERLADALLMWMTKDYVPSSDFTPTYDLDPIPFDNPQRPLRSWSELQAIDVVREMFFDEHGRPNELWHRFTDTFSLFDFGVSNINGGNAGVMLNLNLDDSQQAKLSDYLAGRGAYQSQGPGYFRSSSDITNLLGMQTLTSVGTDIRVLRIIITVRDGQGVYRLNAVVSIGNGGKPVTQKVVNKAVDSSTQAATDAQQQQATATANQQASARLYTGNSTQMPSLNYPFTILQLQENDAPPPPAPPAPADNANSP